MAQSGYTPIQLYYSTTTGNTPTAGNLNNGELAINITDGKLYYKDNTGTVQLLASKSAATPVTSFSAGTTGFTPSTSTTGTITSVGSVALGANATTPGGWLNVGSSDVLINYTLAGTALTTGAATIIVTYAVRNSDGSANPTSQQN